jgi:Prenyltransferase and squalene oxidase repeat
MATPLLDEPESNHSRTDRDGAPPVIRALALSRPPQDGRRALVLTMAFLGSVVIHVVLICAFFFISVRASGAVAPTEMTVISTDVDDDKPNDANLTNPDEGNDPNELLNYDVPRIADVSVPGPVNPTEDPGIKSDAESMPTNIPPPPGMANPQGLGAGPDSDKPGLSTILPAPGGLSGLFTPGGFGARMSGATRMQAVAAGGGNTESEACVARGLAWIAKHQAPDGHWSLDGFNQHGHCNCTGFGQNDDIAATAFGVLPFLGAGETHKKKRSPGKNDIDYSKNVDLALKYLMSKQARDGNFGGTMYSHGLATIAVCEAYGMTSDPLLKPYAQRAINFIRAAQSDNGGWRYSPREGGDTSVTGWQVMALKSGQMANLDVDDARNPTLAKASKWLNSCMTADGSGYGYQGPDTAPTMTAVGLLCRLYMGTGPRNSGIVGGVNRLKQTPPPNGLNSMYYYYYATQVMHHVGGDAWTFWEPKMRQMLMAKQDKGADPKRRHQAGSWSPAGDMFAGSGGRLMSTSLSVLTLEVYYRHLPLYQRDFGGTKQVSAP